MQDWFAQHAPTPPPQAPPASQDWFTANAPSEPTFKRTIRASDGVEDGGIAAFGEELWKRVNPMEFLRFAREAVTHPIATGQRVLQGQGQLLEDAKAEYAKGDYGQAARKFVHYLIPLLGQDMDTASEHFEAGNTARGLGATVGIGTNVAAPEAIGAVARSRVPPVLQHQNPAVRAAVQQGDAAGVPMDLATASGNAFVANTQKVAGNTLGGSSVAGRAVRRQVEALERHGRDLARDVHPQAMTPETAGAATMDALQARVQQFSRTADAAYGTLRQLEAEAAPTAVNVTEMGRVAGGGEIPITRTRDVRLAVDIKAAKEALRPMYDDMLRQSVDLNIPLQGGKARAFAALDRLMQASDAAPLSLVDSALGELKALNRANDTAATSGAHAMTSAAVKALDRQVVLTARNAGPDVLKALLDGRKATVAKYTANDVLDAIAGKNPDVREPVGVFRRATQQGDAAIGRLRQVAREAPEQMPMIGRAVLDDLFETATAEGGFSRGDGLYRKWQALGDQTKQILFAKPGQVQALDNFFLLAKTIGENPNRSGTALVSVSTAELGALGAGAVSGNLGMVAKSLGFAVTTAGLTKLLYSPKVVRLLTSGMTMRSNAPAAAAWAHAFTRAVRDAGVELVPIPAVEAEGTTAKQGSPR